MKIISITLSVIVLMLISSCEYMFMQKQPEKSPNAIFEQVWTFADQNYSFFEYKGINWDSIKTVYQSKINENMTEEALFDTLANMLYLLRDGHVNLYSDFNFSRNWQWYLDYPPNFNYDILERNYFKGNEQFLSSFTMCDFGDVGYIYYGSFMTTVSQSDMNYIMNKFKDYKGLIIDVRNNGGGAIFNIYAIANNFTNKKVNVAFQRDKNGTGHEDFNKGEFISLSPVSDTSYYSKPVVILTNRLCFSATNFFVTIMRELPNVTVVGDSTGGGGGIPTYTELSNGWTVRVSSTRLFTLDSFNVEGGVPPDVKIGQTDSATLAGKDAILDSALAYLRHK